MSKLLFQSNKDIPDDMLLGYMFFQKTPSEVKIEEADLLTAMTASNVDTRYVRKISRSDAFRRATSEIRESVSIQYNGDTCDALVEITQVAQDNDRIVRLLGRKLIDSANVMVDYETVGRIDFDKHAGTMATSVDPNFASEYGYDSILQSALNRFYLYANYHNKETIKNMTLRIIRDMSPISLLDSGIAKFIPVKYKDNLYALRDFISEINPYGAMDGAFEIIPVMDTEEQRDLINRQATLSITEEVTELMVNLSNTLKAKGVLPPGIAKNYLEKFVKIKDIVKDYEETIQCLLPILSQQIEKAVLTVEAASDDYLTDMIDINALTEEDMKLASEI